MIFGLGFIHFSFVQRCRNVHKNSSVSEGESPPRRRRTSRCFGWNAGTCVVRRRPTCRLRREGFSPRRFPTFEWFPWLNRRRFVRRKSRNTHGKLMDDGCASWWLDGWCESDNRCSELTHGFLWCELKKKRVRSPGYGWQEIGIGKNGNPIFNTSRLLKLWWLFCVCVGVIFTWSNVQPLVLNCALRVSWIEVLRQVAWCCC